MFDQKPQQNNSANPPNDLPVSGDIPKKESPMDLYQKVSQDSSQDNMQISPRNAAEPEDILGEIDTDNASLPVAGPAMPNAGFGSTMPNDGDIKTFSQTSGGGKKKIIIIGSLVVVLILIVVAAVMAYQLLMQSESPAPLNVNQGINVNQQPVIFDEPELEPEPVQPVAMDSDGDGLSDDEERIYGTNPFSVDTDGDGLTDRDEIEVFGTDPLNPDTDGDGYTDGEEVRAGYDPKGPGRLFGVEQD